jgi:hypothetical protein
MSTTRHPAEDARENSATFASTFAEERWQGPSFAASWISPPQPQRHAAEHAAPRRENDDA